MTMRSRSSRPSALVVVLVGAFLLAALPALATPAFGPELYVRTSGAPDTYTDSFSSSGGPQVLAVVNGDDGGNRVTGGSVVLNGVTVVSSADFQASTGTFIGVSVNLAPGTNTLSVSLDSEPGSYVTLVILPPGELGDLSAGRLILPWAQAANLVLDVKNGSHHHGRHVRFVFYDADGNAVGASDTIHLAPRAGLSDAAQSLITHGSWTEGSVEIFYCGFGRGRLFGLGVPSDATTGVSSIVALQHAGFRRFGPN
jgi:hypothetical protein